MECTQVVVTQVGDPGALPFFVIASLLTAIIVIGWYLLWRLNPVLLDKLINAIMLVVAGILLIPGFVLPIIRPHDLPWGIILICIAGCLIGNALSNMFKDDKLKKPYLHQVRRRRFWERSR